VTEYIRYKVYDPSRTEDITRLAAVEATVEDIKLSDVTIRGRLTLPDGTVREIGQDSIHERPLQHRATEDTFLQRLFGSEGPVLNEQFVAVEGITPGSVLEFQTESKLRTSYNFIKNLQRLNIPVRHVDCIVDLFQGKEFNGAAFSANPTHLAIDQSFDQKSAVYHISASNLPPLVDEPMSPSINSRSLTVFDNEDNTMLALRHTMSAVRIVSSDGPWAPVAAKVSLIEADATMYFLQAQVNEAKKVVAGAKSETEKARLIHNYVHDRYMSFRESLAGKGPVISHYADMPLDIVMAGDRDGPRVRNRVASRAAAQPQRDAFQSPSAVRNVRSSDCSAGQSGRRLEVLAAQPARLGPLRLGSRALSKRSRTGRPGWQAGVRRCAVHFGVAIDH
jgi:hypothetical protein